MNDLLIINNFPDWNMPGFSVDNWHSQYLKSNVIFNARASSAYYPSHWGPLSVKCAFNGNEFYRAGNCRYRVNDSNYLLLNEGVEYSSEIEEYHQVESFTICFSPSFKDDVLGCFLSSNEKLLDDPGADEFADTCFFEGLYTAENIISPQILFLKKHVDSGNIDQALVYERLHILLASLLTRQKDTLEYVNNMHPVRKSTKIELYKRLRRAKDYLESNFHEKLDISRLAKVACMNNHHFLRQFKLTYKVTPHKYLTGVRLNEAKEMISSGGSSVSEACINSGFEDLSSFSKLFKRHFGKSPAEFLRV